jgi:hypothetical protein
MNDFAKSCISRKDEEGFNFAVSLNCVFNTAGDGHWSTAARAVSVTELGMYVSTEEDSDGDFYGDGDFCVVYDTATWNNDADGLIYTDSEFLKQTQAAVYDALIKLGLDSERARSVADAMDYSEQGMQDTGRVSFDAYELADVLREIYTTA